MTWKSVTATTKTGTSIVASTARKSVRPSRKRSRPNA